MVDFQSTEKDRVESKKERIGKKEKRVVAVGKEEIETQMTFSSASHGPNIASTLSHCNPSMSCLSKSQHQMSLRKNDPAMSFMELMPIQI